MSEQLSKSELTVYVYYKIPADKHNYFLTAVKKLNLAIHALYPQVNVSHQRRPERDAEDRELWMEIYQGVSGENINDFYTDLDKIVQDNNLPKARRYELFTPLLMDS